MWPPANAGSKFGPTSGRCPAESSPARRSASTPVYPRRTPHGAPAPRGPRFPFICRGGVNPPRHRGFGSAKTLGRAGGAGASSALHLVGVQQNRHRPVVLRIHLHIRPERPTGLPPRGDPGSLYLPGRSESAPASRFWLRQNARTRRGRGGEFGPTSGRCPAESSPVRRSANTPACPRRTPHGAPAPRGSRFPFYLPGRSESAPASRFWLRQNARTRRGRGGAGARGRGGAGARGRGGAGARGRGGAGARGRGGAGARGRGGAGARGRVRPYIWSVSSRIVTGPSFCEYTCMSAPNSPCSTRKPRPAHSAINFS